MLLGSGDAPPPGAPQSQQTRLCCDGQCMRVSRCFECELIRAPPRRAYRVVFFSPAGKKVASCVSLRRYCERSGNGVDRMRALFVPGAGYAGSHLLASRTEEDDSVRAPRWRAYQLTLEAPAHSHALTVAAQSRLLRLRCAWRRGVSRSEKHRPASPTSSANKQTSQNLFPESA
jgi:hypothetical protein